jgi:hypothetical protein
MYPKRKKEIMAAQEDCKKMLTKRALASAAAGLSPIIGPDIAAEEQKGWKDFGDELRRCNQFLKKNYHYNPGRWIQMWSNSGLEEATKQIVKMPDSTGLEWLYLKHLLDLSIEAIVLKPEYREMWEAEEKKDGVAYRELCREKLKRLGWKDTEIQIQS